MRISAASRRLAARGHARQNQAHRRSVAAANSADRAVLGVWRRFLRLLDAGLPWPQLEREAYWLFAGLVGHVRRRVGLDLLATSEWGWRSAVYALRRSLPQQTLLVAAVTESEESRQLALTDFFSGPDSLLDHLFPPPSAFDVQRIVFGHNWEARLAACSRLAPPAVVAQIVAGGVAAGKSQQEIARQLAPLVDNVRASARRIARTESLRVAGAMQMQAHERLGSLVIGYQVHSMHDIHTRPWHLARDGTTYYRDPKPGQKGMRQCPHPPDEPEDPAERPAGAPQTAWNCRCFLTPVLRD